MNLSELNNPNNIEGLLLWKNGKSIEIGRIESTGFQEYPNCVELWQKMEDGRLFKIRRWLKKSITHYVINNSFVAK